MVRIWLVPSWDPAKRAETQILQMICQQIAVPETREIQVTQPLATLSPGTPEYISLFRFSVCF